MRGTMWGCRVCVLVYMYKYGRLRVEVEWGEEAACAAVWEPGRCGKHWYKEVREV